MQQVFQISTLQIFNEDELDYLLCGCNEMWTVSDSLTIVYQATLLMACLSQCLMLFILVDAGGDACRAYQV